ncbi:MAG: Stp1/IreP family PP2C-type Ser/Thr phosphatase [Oscillospiraceae bacterium]|nr:Stp1/IreP family PP2C-type Ser/Thr phosphatase [Oscillospiraceae bacterium]
MKVDSVTDIGLVRAQNEDDVATGLLPDGAWAVVCDGMGGANAGEVASQNAVQVITDTICQNYSEGASDNAIKYLLHDALCEANTILFNLSNEYQHLSGMGTTAVAAVITQGKAHVCHAGDSRAYLLREESVQQVTKDHSIVQELVDAGTLTPEQAQLHPQRNIITRCLGVRESVDVDYREFPVQPGDVLLLCSDGLSTYFTEEELLQESRQRDPSSLIRRLVELAKERGGRDNITAAVIEN